MYQTIVPRVLRMYKLPYVAVFPAQKGYRSESYRILLKNDTNANLIFFKREHGIVERVNRADAVAAIAGKHGLPVRVRSDPRLVRLQENAVAGLYTYLPGYTIAWEAYTMKHIKLLGWAMADLHTALRDFHDPTVTSHTVTAELMTQSDRMTAYFKDTTVTQAMATKLGVSIDENIFDSLRLLLSEMSDIPGQQMLHQDMVRGNVLFAHNQSREQWTIGDVSLSGIIDFEKTAYGHVLFDLARTLAFLLVDCNSKEPIRIRKYFIESGYLKRGKVPIDLQAQHKTRTYKSILNELTTYYLLYDFYKFLRHTPYESLAENHHYVQTRNILIDQAMLRYL